jgi:GxxExxY protein
MTRQEYQKIYEVVGAAMEVHKTMGRGLAEAIYQEALAIEMRNQGIQVE